MPDVASLPESLWHTALSPAMPDVASVPESLWNTELSPAMSDVASVPESMWHTELSPAMPDVAAIPESPAVAHSTEHLRLWHLHSVEPHNTAHHPQQVPLAACVGELRLSHLRLWHPHPDGTTTMGCLYPSKSH